MGWLVSAIIQGLFGGLLNWWNQRQAAKDRLTVERQNDVIESDRQVELDQKEIESRAKAARDSAVPDFTQLR